MSDIYPVENEIVASCQALLLPNGWQRANGIAIATKEYKTAVGIKVAMAYMLPAGETEYRLSAEYQSQGRNILSLCTTYILREHSPESLEAVINKFAKDIDDCVAESYAYRLLHEKGHSVVSESY